MFDIQNIQVQKVIQFNLHYQNQTDCQDDSCFSPNSRQINRYDCGKWKTSGLHLISSKIHVWRIKKLWLNGNLNSQILKEIQTIKFPDLRVLLLNSNNIFSVQSLTTAEFPSLEHLNLAKNHISELRILRKGKWPSLAILCLNDNKIKDFDSLSELKSQNMKEIVLEMVSSKQTGTVNWVGKMESGSLEQIMIRSRQRIKSERVVQRLKMRSQDIVINCINS